MTGIPAVTACCTNGVSVAGSGMLTAMPSTLESIAACRSFTCSVMSPPEAAYWTSTLSFLAAASAPFTMMSKNT